MKSIFGLFLLGFMISSCGNSKDRNDDRDRGQMQACLDEGGTPLYKEHVNDFDDTVTISFIACDRN